MNHDDTHPELQPLIETEIEARLVAWVLGEASAFEIAELERLCREKPELAIFKRRIEAVHGLVGEAARPDTQPLRLSPERRAKVLQAVGLTPDSAAPSPEEKSSRSPLVVFRQSKRRDRRWMMGIAAGVAISGILAVLWVPTMDMVEENFSGRPMRPNAAQTVTGSDVAELRMTESAHRKEEGRVATEAKRRRMARPESRGGADAPAPPASPSPALIVAGEARSSLNSRQSGALDALVPPGPSSSGAGSTVTPTLSVTRSNTAIQDLAKLSASNDWRDSSGQLAPNNYEDYLILVPRSQEAGNRKASVDGGTPTERPAEIQFERDGGQTKAKENGRRDEEAIVLSAFSVDAEKERGYLATKTIAGTRITTDLKDIASSISVITKQDLLDQPATEPKRALESGEKKQVANKSVSAGAPDETRTAVESVSTFSLHVSDASFQFAQAALARGEVPDPARIRPEEFYNAFDYGDPAPAPGEKIGCRIEQAAHPFLQQRNLVRIAMRVPATGRAGGRPLHLTVLLDTSGSMEREDRRATVQRALGALGSLLKPEDRVTLIGFARQPRLLAENLPGDQAGQLRELAAQTPADGGTNLEAALELAIDKAHESFDPDAQNRIVLMTDGAANLGNADPAALAMTIETTRQQGIAFDACGVGTNGLDDEILEALTRKGDGRYYVLESPEDADVGFARKLAGAFRPAAQNVKMQVRFNPARVAHYRLIGFEQHRLREEDFRNDKVDAAELAAEEAAVAVYQVEVLPEGEGELGDVFVRFRDTASGAMVENFWTIGYEPRIRAFDQATPSLQLAGVAALLAEKLRGSAMTDLVRLEELGPVVNRLRGHYIEEDNVQVLIGMFEHMRRISGE